MLIMQPPGFSLLIPASAYNEGVTVDEIRTVTSPVFERHGVAYAALFGSTARGEDRPQSDVDILVRLGQRTGMAGYMRLLEDLEAALHKSVDLVTEQSLNKHLRPMLQAILPRSMKDDRVYLEQILECIRNIREFVAGITRGFSRTERRKARSSCNWR